MFVKAPPAWFNRQTVAPFVLLQAGLFASTDNILVKIAVFFAKAGTFVFGSGLAIVPFLHAGVVTENHWLNEQQFIDAVAVAMITPGPVVITVGFIGFLVAGLAGASVAAAATFLPCYLLTVLPAPYFKKIAANKSIKAFVDGITAAVVGAIAGAVAIIASRSITDIPTILIAAFTAAALLYYKKLQEPYVILLAAILGILIKNI
jgi:chromate transporter